VEEHAQTVLRLFRYSKLTLVAVIFAQISSPGVKVEKLLKVLVLGIERLT